MSNQNWQAVVRDVSEKAGLPPFELTPDVRREPNIGGEFEAQMQDIYPAPPYRPPG